MKRGNSPEVDVRLNNSYFLIEVNFTYLFPPQKPVPTRGKESTMSEFGDGSVSLMGKRKHIEITSDNDAQHIELREKIARFADKQDDEDRVPREVGGGGDACGDAGHGEMGGEDRQEEQQDEEQPQKQGEGGEQQLHEQHEGKKEALSVHVYRDGDGGNDSNETASGVGKNGEGDEEEGEKDDDKQEDKEKDEEEDESEDEEENISTHYKLKCMRCACHIKFPATAQLIKCPVCTRTLTHSCLCILLLLLLLFFFRFIFSLCVVFACIYALD